MDRISELPKDIIHHIYSFLPTKYVLNTCRLSNLWHSIFLSYPCIDLDQSSFTSRVPNGAQSNIENDLKFSKYVNGSIRRLHKHNLDIKKFRLILARDKWEAETIYQSVKEVLGFCRNIRDLELYNCVLERCLPEEGVDFPCLNKLSLKLVKLDEFTLEKLLESCPEVSDFSYDHCVGSKRSPSISRLIKLKNLKVLLTPNFVHNDIIRVAIDAPALENLHINCGYCGNVELVIGRNLKNLVVESGDVFNAESLEYILSKSPNLESLSFRSLWNLEGLNIASHSLKSLKIGPCLDLRDCKINAPNLRTFSYEGYYLHEICFVSVVRCWWRIELDLLVELHQLSDLKNFLQGKKIKYLTITINKGLLNSREISGISPCCEVEHLSLWARSGSIQKTRLGLVLMCQPKNMNPECNVKSTSFLMRIFKATRSWRSGTSRGKKKGLCGIN